MSQIPTLHSRVYYFPQCHFHQASSPPQYLSPLLLSNPFVPCRIVVVQFLVDPLTDEVFANLLLHPLNTSAPHLLPLTAKYFDDAPDDENNFVSFAKILTPSDANNGGEFSIPRFCADSIFPQLNFHAEATPAHHWLEQVRQQEEVGHRRFRGCEMYC